LQVSKLYEVKITVVRKRLASSSASCIHRSSSAAAVVRRRLQISDQFSLAPGASTGHRETIFLRKSLTFQAAAGLISTSIYVTRNRRSSR